MVFPDPTAQQHFDALDRKDAELRALADALEEARSNEVLVVFEHDTQLAERDMIIADLRVRVARAELLVNMIRQMPVDEGAVHAWYGEKIVPILAVWPTNRA